MATFRDSNQVYETIGELMDQAKKDPKIGPKIASAGIVIQFRYSDPEAVTTVNARDKATQPGAFCDVINGPCDLKPDATLSMKADIAHAFWQGKVNLLTAIAKKEIVIQGPLPKILKLLPAVEPLYKVYPAMLRAKGLGEMVLK